MQDSEVDPLARYFAGMNDNDDDDDDEDDADYSERGSEKEANDAEHKGVMRLGDEYQARLDVIDGYVWG